MAVTPADPIFHLALPNDWAEAFRAGEYTMSTRGVTLQEEGFIHCSTIRQVEGVANRFYADVEQVVMLVIDPAQVGAEIRWEAPAPDVADLFPHVYGALPIASVVRSTLWFRSAAGWSLRDLEP